VPLLKIQTNIEIAAETKEAIVKTASVIVADKLGKAERYVMVVLESTLPMAFAGSDAPCAYLELKSIGLVEETTKSLSASLCQFIDEQLGISADRVYIEFVDVPRVMWGWNGSTF